MTALAVGGAAYGFARASGGYYPDSWPLLGGLLVAACATAVAVGAVPRRSLAAAAFSLAGLGAVAAASVAWGGIPGPAWTTLDQALLAAAALVLGAAAAATAESLAEAVVTGVGLGLCLLAGELLYRLQAGEAPDSWFDGRKIQGAVGYHNALGAFFAVGIPIALWAGVHRAAWLRAAGGAAVVGLTGGLLLTQSRGAVLAAVLAGAVLVLVVRELRTTTFALLAALAGLLLLIPLRGVDAQLIDHPGGSPAEFRRFALWTVGLGLVAAVAAALPLTRRVGRALLAVTAAAAVLGAAVGLAIVRPDPGELRARLDRVTSEGNPAYLPAGSTRLASVSLTGRRHVWRVALDAYADRPLLGEGSGRFARTWGVERWNKDLYVLQPHSLELELLSELGLPGLLALVCFVGFALVALVRSPAPPRAARRRRRRPRRPARRRPRSTGRSRSRRSSLRRCSSSAPARAGSGAAGAASGAVPSSAPPLSACSSCSRVPTSPTGSLRAPSGPPRARRAPGTSPGARGGSTRGTSRRWRSRAGSPRRAAATCSPPPSTPRRPSGRSSPGPKSSAAPVRCRPQATPAAPGRPAALHRRRTRSSRSSRPGLAPIPAPEPG